jgi:hypothetical protein
VPGTRRGDPDQQAGPDLEEPPVETLLEPVVPSAERCQIAAARCSGPPWHGVVEVASVRRLVAGGEDTGPVPGLDLPAHPGGRPVAGPSVGLVVTLAGRVAGAREPVVDALRGPSDGHAPVIGTSTLTHIGQCRIDDLRQRHDLGIDITAIANGMQACVAVPRRAGASGTRRVTGTCGVFDGGTGLGQ